MKRLIVPMALAGALALAGCSGADTTSSSAADSNTAEETPQVPDLAGAWKQSNPTSEDSYQQARIATDTITIEWATDGGDTTSTYWVGTFEAPTDASEPHTWTSQRDAAATDSALLASTDDTKEFTYEGDTISYKVSALGTTTTVDLNRS